MSDFRFDEEKFHDALVRLVQENQIACEQLTGLQLAKALGAAIKAGDFQRCVTTDSRQQVFYQPYFALSRLQFQHDDLKVKFRELAQRINAHACTCSGCQKDAEWVAEELKKL